MKKVFRLDNIFSVLSIYISKAYHIQHTIDWKENKTRSGFVLWVVTEGKILLNVEQKEYMLEKGDAVLFYPNDTYTASTTDEGCKHIYVYFSLEMGEMELLSDINLAGIVSHRYISKQTNEFIQYFLASSPTYQNRPLKMHAHFLSYVSDIIDLLRYGKGILFYDTTQINSNNIIQTAIKHIEKNYNEISVKNLASILHMSEKNFIAAFKKNVGITPWQYILQCRMRKSAKLLSEGNIKMSGIAKKVGYADQYIFSKAFKKYYGISPLEFKKNVSFHNKSSDN